MDGTDPYSNLYHNNFDVSQYQLQKVRIRKGSNWKYFAFKLLQFCDLKTQQRFILQEEVNFSQKELIFLLTVCAIFAKLLMKRASVYRFHYRNSKLRLDQQSRKTTSLLNTKKIKTYPNEQIRLPFWFGNNNSCVFSTKKIELHGQHFVLAEIVKRNHREIQHLYKNRFYDVNNCKMIESNYDVMRFYTWLPVLQKQK